jgi:hypothetical protein
MVLVKCFLLITLMLLLLLCSLFSSLATLPSLAASRLPVPSSVNWRDLLSLHQALLHSSLLSLSLSAVMLLPAAAHCNSSQYWMTLVRYFLRLFVAAARQTSEYCRVLAAAGWRY